MQRQESTDRSKTRSIALCKAIEREREVELWMRREKVRDGEVEIFV
jgi:hypothetical protein